MDERDILVLIEQRRPGEPAQMRRLARAFPARIHKAWM